MRIAHPAPPALEEFADLIGRLPADARTLVAGAWPESGRRLDRERARIWLEGATQLTESGAGLAALVSYLRELPAVAAGREECFLEHAIDVCQSILRCADQRALEIFLESLPLASRRLASPDELNEYLDLVQELSGLAPLGLTPLFQRLGVLLEQLSVGGLRRWALLGVQGHTDDPALQGAWFRLESQDARAILRSASDGTLFTDVERRLGFYFRALWGRDPDLRPASVAPDGKKGKRVSILDGTIHMPRAFEVFPGQDGPELYRAAAAHAAAHLTFSTERLPVRTLKPVQVALASLIEDARVETLAMQEMPGLKRLWLPFHVALPTFTMTTVSMMARLARGLIDPDYEDDNPFVKKGRRLFAESLRDIRAPHMSRTIGGLLGNDLGQMRVQFNFKTYLIEPIYRDDNLHLWDFGDASQAPPDDQEVIQQAANLTPEKGGELTDMELEDRGSEAAEPEEPEERVRLEAPEPAEQAAIDDALLQPHQYDEWDYVIQMDRPAWCTVLEKPAELGDPRHIDDILRRNRDVVNRLASMIKAVQIQRPKRLKKQSQGDCLDIDACIAATIDLRSGRAPDPRVHQRLGRSSRDLAVLLLLDLSQSTNDLVAGTGTTVLNLAREATALVADAMHRLGDDFAIHGFESNGRHEVEYYRFKDFGEDYEEQARARLAGMRGQLSTRMGTALRHAGTFLRDRHVGHKLILLVTDGKPHDVDVHDEQYLVFDTKRAVENLRRTGVATFCLSLDVAADEYVSRIFGARNYLVLDQLRRLPEKLPALYLRLTS
jgi:nitric oxide reductase NorD protein